MSAYLQRLYDAAVTETEARPAQRSGSPLPVVDQRLAAPRFVASFLMGTPGDADATEVLPADQPEPAGAPWPDLTHSADVVPTLDPPSPVIVPEQVLSQAPSRAREPEPEVLPVMAAVREPVPPPVARLEPTPQDRDHPPQATPVAQPRQTPAVELPSTDPLVIDRRAIPPVPPVEVTAEREVATSPSPAPRTVSAKTEPVPPEPVPPEPVPARATQPELMAPAPLRVEDPLPPPASPSPAGAEASGLADQVRRLVREAMSESAAGPRSPQGRAAAEVGSPAPSAPSRQSAEQMSVIGPLDRPAKASTLYGLRLR